MMRLPVNQRFRGFLPVIIDVETAGFEADIHALLEIAAVIVLPDKHGDWRRVETHACHVVPFEGSKLNQASLDFIGVDPFHPFRQAIDEKEALTKVFTAIRAAVKKYNCSRAILVGHNAAFDLAFINAAIKRTQVKRSPFHQFSCFDTATLAGLACQQTVLAKAAKKVGIAWDNEQAHSAIYDAERTAELFCYIVNRWDALNPSL